MGDNEPVVLEENEIEHKKNQTYMQVLASSDDQVSVERKNFLKINFEKP